ncbi:C40 family peptidase [Cryobacterium sp. GrIS_2_6]|uniref:C40 family peptidase n=1 Tax=Cryobacterium sp. GrIS_2_6 TaxID=3162785 RepID=UPI002E0B1825|nr:cell wall-associated NlpC family hydrolase [Cryobacterium psychrotolerans]
MAEELGRRLSRRGSAPTPARPAPTPAQREKAPARGIFTRPSRRHGAIANIVTMTLAGGLVATMAIPAYAFAPSSPGTDTAHGTTASTALTRAGAQSLTVAGQASTVSVARDGFSATTPEEIAAAKAAAAATAAAAAAEARRVAAAASMTTYAAAYSGPSVSDFLANPSYPTFSLASVYNVGLQYQGVPYVYGGSTPAGFDCSGFVMYVYAQFGISLPHSAAGQGATGTRISLADAQPGDLVIMDGHDGIYAGNGNILHAPYEGASVRVQPIWTSSYYIVRLGI